MKTFAARLKRGFEQDLHLHNGVFARFLGKSLAEALSAVNPPSPSVACDGGAHVVDLRPKKAKSKKAEGGRQSA